MTYPGKVEDNNGPSVRFSNIFKEANSILKNIKDYLPKKEEIKNKEKEVCEANRCFWVASDLYDRLRNN